MNISPHQFPNQKLTTAEKKKIYGSIEEWGEAVVSSLIGIGSQMHYLAYDDTYRKQINYNLVSGYVNGDDFKYVTKPFGLSKYNFPATFTNYNIITPKISLLEGEESKRPFNFRIVATDHDSTNEILREKTQMMHQLFQQTWMQELQKLGVNVKDEKAVQQNTPQEIESYFKNDYQSTRENQAQSSLDYLTRYLEVVDKFNTGWRDLLITGEEVYWVGVVAGEPRLEVVNNVYFHYDKNPDLRFIEDAAWAYREFFVPPGDVYDKYFDLLTEEQVEQIENMKGGRTGNTITNTSIGVPIRYTGVDDVVGAPTIQQDSTIFVHVVHCEWKSLKKVGFVSWVDEEGQPQELMVDETYKQNPFNGETVEWMWINTVWEATRIGTDIYVNVREKPNQYRSIDNPSRCKLGYVGIVYNARNSMSYSLTEIMKPHQYLYNIIMYRLELELARAQGKKMIFDVAQIPRSEGFDVEKWLYYFNVLGIAFINSFEEGKGKFAGQRPTFNQFQAIDMSLARVIDQYVQLLEKIEQMVGEICGITRQREGTISSSETVGGVERSVQQSSYITEPLFVAHNMCKQHVLIALLECAKLAWSEGKKINFVMDDMTRILLEIDGTDICNAEFGVFVSNNSKDDQIFNSIKQFAQAAMQAEQASLLDIVAILEAQNVTKTKEILKRSEEKRQQAIQAQQQHEQELQAQALQVQAQQVQVQQEFADKLNQRDNDTKIQVALIGAESAEAANNPEADMTKVHLDAQNKRQDINNNRLIKEKALEIKKKEGQQKLEFDKDYNKEDINIKKTESSAGLSLDKSLGQKELDNKIAIEKQKLELEKEKARKEQEFKKAQAIKESNAKIALEKERLAQEDIQHQREQTTALEAERIKAKAVKNKPKPTK